MKNISFISRQRGVALFVSLVFLVIITILSLSAINTSVMEQKMASNSQLDMEAQQYTQLIQDVVHKFIYDGNSGFEFIAGDERTVCINKTDSIKKEDGSYETCTIGNLDKSKIETSLGEVATDGNFLTNFTAEIVQFKQLHNVRKKAGEAGHISIAPYEIIATYTPNNVTFVRGYNVAGDASNIGDGSKIISGGPAVDGDTGFF